MDMYIDGKFTSGKSSERIQIINPATEEIVGDFPRGTEADALAAVDL